MESSSSSNRSEDRPAGFPYWIAALLVLGVGFSLYLACGNPKNVYFSGDGGIKAIMTRQFADGVWGTDIKLPAAPWAEKLWNQGYYPFAKPFVYDSQGRHVQAFAVYFPIISAPFFAIAGHYGLYVIPLISLWVVWLEFYFFCRAFAIRQTPSFLGLATLIFATPLTFYGATFWEHTLAVALSFGGLYFVTMGCLLSSPFFRKRRVLLAGGFILAVAAWFRPEHACVMCAVLVAMLVVSFRHGRLREYFFFAAAATVTSVTFMAINGWLYHHPLGPHSYPMMQHLSFMAHLTQESLPLALLINKHLFQYLPVLFFVLFFSCKIALEPPAQDRSAFFALLMMTLMISLSVPLIIATPGGNGWGPRYLLGSTPLIAFAATILLSKLKLAPPKHANTRSNGQAPQSRDQSPSSLLAALIVLGWVAFIATAALGASINSYDGAKTLKDNYRFRIAPALRFIEQRPEKVAIINVQYIAQELPSQLYEKTFFRYTTVEQLMSLTRDLRQHDVNHFLLIMMYEGTMPQVPPVVTEQGFAHRLLVQPLIHNSSWMIYQVDISD